MSPYNQYTGSKPPPLWLKVVGMVAAIFAMLAYVGCGWIWLAVTRPDRKSENG